MGCAFEAIGRVRGAMSELYMTLYMMETIVASANHGMRAERALLGAWTAKGSENDPKIGTIPGVAL